MTLLEEASLSYGITTACQALAVPRSWYYRQKGVSGPTQENPEARPTPKHALSKTEKARMREVLNGERFVNDPSLKLEKGDTILILGAQAGG